MADRTTSAAVAAGGLGAVAMAAGAAGLRAALRARRERERKFRLRSEEPPAAGLRRIARGQVDLAADHLTGREGGDSEERVHEARKAFKRLRTTARLARDGLGRDVRRRENRTWRDAGRRLAGPRDAAVKLETLDALTERYSSEVPDGAFAGLRDGLAASHEAARAELEDSPDPEAVLGVLEAGRERVAGWTFAGDPDFLSAGLRRIYRRGRRAYLEARKNPTTERLHEWRKRVKDLWHAAQILRPADPKRLRPLARDAHGLSDLLGDDHDLAVLRAEALRGRREYFVDSAERDALTALIDRRRAELRRAALDLGAKVYARKPRALRGQTPSVGATQGV
jgi:CHAD domain-containing protein